MASNVITLLVRAGRMDHSALTQECYREFSHFEKGCIFERHLHFELVTFHQHRTLEAYVINNHNEIFREQTHISFYSMELYKMWANNQDSSNKYISKVKAISKPA